MEPAVEPEQDDLLAGLKGPAREARAELLGRLRAAGASEDELARAAREHRLVLLLVDRRLRPTHTANDVAEATGLPVELLLRTRRLLGLREADADEAAFTERDFDRARSLRSLIDAGIPPEAVGDLTRVLGEAMSRLAAAVTVVFAQSFLSPGDSELEVAERFDRLAGELIPLLDPVVVGAFEAHLRESVTRGSLRPEELESGRPAAQVHLNVCFADLVGFTRLGGSVEVQELGALARRLGELAGEVAGGPVRLIKTIGDAVMLVSDEPAPLVAAALELIEAAEAAEDVPSLRAGIACGPAVARGGDWFGHSVNLASRVTGAARPDSVLVTQEVRDRAVDAFKWSFAGRFRLKGISGSEPLHRARPLDPASS